MDILKKFSEDEEKSTALEDAFKSCRFPDTLTISLLAADIGATREEVEVTGLVYCTSIPTMYEQTLGKFLQHSNIRQPEKSLFQLWKTISELHFFHEFTDVL